MLVARYRRDVGWRVPQEMGYLVGGIGMSGCMEYHLCLDVHLTGLYVFCVVSVNLLAMCAM